MTHLKQSLGVTYIATALLIAQVTACGTLLDPERRGPNEWSN